MKEMIKIKFEIKRASWGGWGGKEPPVKNAYKKNKDNSHLINWYIDINSLQELMKLQEKAGEEIIIGEDKGGKYIIIYDDYRES